MKEYCGLFGIYNHPEAARLTYFGLYALQHRGQESAGIVTWDGKKQREVLGMGLVPDVFTEEHLSHQLVGDIAIGHTSYTCSGLSALRNAQPFKVRYKDMDISIAHNGKLVNTDAVRSQLESEGSIFQTGMDCEIFVHLIAKFLKKYSLEDAMMHACREVRGAYCLLIMAGNKMIAVRDPNGFHPLLLGTVGSSHVIASETCAFDLMEATFMRNIEPGEMVVVDESGLTSYDMAMNQKHSYCIFELVYFARPDSTIFNQNVYICREKMGRILAQEAPAEADFVMPFPDSGVYATVGYSHESGLPYEHAMIRNHYVGRTFIQPSQDMREFSVRVKINPVKELIKGKSIVIVDDSIVRGTTIRTRVKKLRELGAREIHFRVSSPPVVAPCFYGVDFASPKELVAANYSIKEIQESVGLDSLHYLSLDGLKKTVAHPENYCCACFTGEYPVDCSACMHCHK